MGGITHQATAQSYLLEMQQEGTLWLTVPHQESGWSYTGREVGFSLPGGTELRESIFLVHFPHAEQSRNAFQFGYWS